MPSVPVEERRETARAQLSKKVCSNFEISIFSFIFNFDWKAMPKAVEKIDGGNPEDSVEAVKKELKQVNLI